MPASSTGIVPGGESILQRPSQDFPDIRERSSETVSFRIGAEVDSAIPVGGWLAVHRHPDDQAPVLFVVYSV